ncbi:DUF4397 domain-containing protein [Priestia endophytica]|uniref:DUF4397 domain-containing protein n=1 Tax=Priestia endophytica TaxID=135735 RepID=UPI000DCA4457|nr:DUF4397 domain-containing protein [Priestia endophytica]RAS74288.1 hypothetical protein A4U60_24155 [Priestia endophytica]
MRKLWLVLFSAIIMFPSLAHAEEKETLVRIVNASNNNESVDIYIDHKPAVEGALFKNATDYMTLKEGAHTIEVYRSGEKETPLIVGDVETEGNQAYTVIAFEKEKKMSLKLLNDETSAPKGKANVRVLNLAPVSNDLEASIKNGKKLFDNLAFNDVSSYEEIKAESKLHIKDNDKKVTSLSQTLQSGSAYTVLAVNSRNQVETVLLQDNAILSPSLVPKTGMGGMSSSHTLSYAALVILGGCVFFLRRRHQ